MAQGWRNRLEHLETRRGQARGLNPLADTYHQQAEGRGFAMSGCGNPNDCGAICPCGLGKSFLLLGLFSFPYLFSLHLS
jgi:hypothetical protein